MLAALSDATALDLDTSRTHIGTPCVDPVSGRLASIEEGMTMIRGTRLYFALELNEDGAPNFFIQALCLKLRPCV